VSAVIVLLLTGPLTIGFVTLIVNGLASVKTIWNPQSWPLLVGLVLVAFAPFAIFGLFSFAGAVAADGVGSRLGAHGGRMASNAARGAARIPTRLGGLPSGIRPAGNHPSTTGPSGKPATTRLASTGAPVGAPKPAQARATGRDDAGTASTSPAPQQSPPRPPSPAAAPQPPKTDRSSS
jgi:hypothetical protein